MDTELTLDALRVELIEYGAKTKLERIEEKVNLMLVNAIKQRDQYPPGILAHNHWNDIVTILTEIMNTA